jgi:hydrogenase-4 component E
MSEVIVVALVACGLAIVSVRRRSVAIALMTAQSLLLGVGALTLSHDRSADFLVCGVVLLVKAVVLPVLLLLATRRTRETRLVVAPAPAVARLLIAASAALVVAAAAPSLAPDDGLAERAAFGLVAIGISIVVLRRPVILQALGLLVVENGVYLLAVSTPGGVPFALDLGVLFDLTIVLTVVVGFTHRIHEEFGSGDTERLRELRD